MCYVVYFYNVNGLNLEMIYFMKFDCLVDFCFSEDYYMFVINNSFFYIYLEDVINEFILLFFRF